MSMLGPEEDLITVRVVTAIVNSVGDDGLLIVVGIVVKGQPLTLQLAVSPALKAGPNDKELGNAITEDITKFMNKHAYPILIKLH
jgi:hypothetical protein